MTLLASSFLPSESLINMYIYIEQCCIQLEGGGGIEVFDIVEDIQYIKSSNLRGGGGWGGTEKIWGEYPSPPP